MPSNNSWGYKKIFIAAVERKYGFDKKQMWAIEQLMRDICEKAPSKTMGGSGFADDFFIGAAGLICAEKWCGNESCLGHSSWYLYYCNRDCQPSKCPEWKAFRKKWRSYPDKEGCRGCSYFRPKGMEENKYSCYCRKKELPEHCPKRPGAKKGGAS